jgi:hypothetical protein
MYASFSEKLSEIISPRLPIRTPKEFLQTLSFQLDLPLPMSRTDRKILPMEELHVREQFPKYIGSVSGTGVLLQLEDGQRQTICTSCDFASS